MCWLTIQFVDRSLGVETQEWRQANRWTERGQRDAIDKLTFCFKHRVHKCVYTDLEMRIYRYSVMSMCLLLV